MSRLLNQYVHWRHESLMGKIVQGCESQLALKRLLTRHDHPDIICRCAAFTWPHRAGVSFKCLAIRALHAHNRR